MLLVKKKFANIDKISGVITKIWLLSKNIILLRKSKFTIRLPVKWNICSSLSCCIKSELATGGSITGSAPAPPSTAGASTTLATSSAAIAGCSSIAGAAAASGASKISSVTAFIAACATLSITLLSGFPTTSAIWVGVPATISTAVYKVVGFVLDVDDEDDAAGLGGVVVEGVVLGAVGLGGVAGPVVGGGVALEGGGGGIPSGFLLKSKNGMPFFAQI